MLWIRHIAARHFRHMGHVSIQLAEGQNRPKNLVVLGPNGSGKTSLFEAMTDELEQVIRGVAHPAEVLLGVNGEPTSSVHAEASDEIRHAFVGRPVCLQWTQPSSSVSEGYRQSEFISVYLSQPRATTLVRGMPTELVPSALYPPRERLAASFHDYVLSFRSEDDPLPSTSSRRRPPGLYRSFGEFLVHIRRLFAHAELSFVRSRDALFLDFADGRRVDLRHLSLGHRAALSIFSEVLLRVEATRERRDDAQHQPAGVVLIDAVETGLDSTLQRTILPVMQAIFPNIQWCVTTHSPWVAASVDDALIVDLSDRSVRSAEEFREWNALPWQRCDAYRMEGPPGSDTMRLGTLSTEIPTDST